MSAAIREEQLHETVRHTVYRECIARLVPKRTCACLCRFFAPRLEDALPQPLEPEFGIFLRSERERDAHERRDARVRQEADARNGEDTLLERGRRDEGGGVTRSGAILRQLQVQEELHGKFLESGLNARGRQWEERDKPEGGGGSRGNRGKRTYEHARFRTDPRRQSVEVLVRDLFKHVPLLLVERCHASAVREEAVESPLVQQDNDHRLRGRAVKR